MANSGAIAKGMHAKACNKKLQKQQQKRKPAAATVNDKYKKNRCMSHCNIYEAINFGT